MSKPRKTETTDKGAKPQQAGSLDLTRHMAMAFGTPVVAYQWPNSKELNDALCKTILQKQVESGGIARSNVNGWHSTVDFFSWDADCVRQVAKRVEQLLIGLTRAVTIAPEHGTTRSFNYRLDGWANVSRRGAYNTVHNHPNCLWSGVYYVSAGKPDPEPRCNGKLELLDPRVGTNMQYMKGTVFDARYLIDPLPGLMVMFPAWLNHFVHPFLGDGDRISVAFNIVTTEIPSAEHLA